MNELAVVTEVLFCAPCHRRETYQTVVKIGKRVKDDRPTMCGKDACFATFVFRAAR